MTWGSPSVPLTPSLPPSPRRQLGTPSAEHGDDLGVSQCAGLLREVHHQVQELFEMHHLTKLP